MAISVHSFAPNLWLMERGGTETDYDMLLILLAAYTYFLAINAGAFMAVAWDKRQARRGGKRLAGANFIALAAGGGWLGAKLGQSFLKHRTRQRPVAVALNIAPLGHVAFAIVAFASLIPLS